MPSIINLLQNARQRSTPSGTISPAAQTLGLAGAGDVTAQQLQELVKRRKKPATPSAFGDATINAARGLFGGR